MTTKEKAPAVQAKATKHPFKSAALIQAIREILAKSGGPFSVTFLVDILLCAQAVHATLMVMVLVLVLVLVGGAA